MPRNKSLLICAKTNNITYQLPYTKLRKNKHLGLENSPTVQTAGRRDLYEYVSACVKSKYNADARYLMHVSPTVKTFFNNNCLTGSILEHYTH